MPESATFRLGIIGGCMSHQVGIPMRDLYHRQLADQLEATRDIRVRVHIARSFGAGYVSRLESLLAQRELDGVMLHLRVSIMRRSRLVLEQVVDGRKRRYLNPVLLDRSHSGPRVDALRARENAGAQRMRRGGQELQERAARHDRRRLRRRRYRAWLDRINWALGSLVGLDRWAVENELVVLREFLAACAARGLPVAVLGPTPMIGRDWQYRTAQMLNARMRGFAAEAGVPVALIEQTHDAAGRPLVKADGLHLTPEGHGFVAGRLLDAGMADWMSSIIRSRQDLLGSPLDAAPER